MSMRIPTQIPPTIFETFPRLTKQISPRVSAPVIPQSRRINMANTGSSIQQPLSFANYKVDNKNLDLAAGVSLSDPQKVITGSVLDLFGGRPSLRKLTLWKDDASFVDPLTIAEGRKQYSAQWYGMPVAFSNIDRLSCKVTSGGNPIEVEMKNKYTIKGIGAQQTIADKVKIFTEGEGDNMRIKKVEDRWDDSLPSGAFTDALRNLNSVTVPLAVSVPKSIEEEEGK